MYRAKRVRRDSPENIYKHCKLAGTCPPDVENKIEHNTLADRLLRIFGSIIYLGGLGIGTGSGTGSSLGFRPLPETVPLPDTVPPNEIPTVEVPVDVTVRPTRPPSTFGVRIDPISSASNIPKVVRPGASSIVPLNEGLPDPTTFITRVNGESEILTTIDELENIDYIAAHPTVITGRNDIAILDITPSEAPPRRVLFESNTTEGRHILESSLSRFEPFDVFVDPSYSGVHVGENIELEPINTIAEFEIEESVPRTSTPSQILQRTIGRARQLYNRFTEQAQTRNLDFLGQPSRAIQFEFDNPAFSPDVTLTFERDLAEVAAAPDPTFTDVILLERPQYSETDQGLLRFSRLGERGKISTRSGTVLRQKVHFFYDLSPITPVEESLELQVIDEASDNMTIVDELSRNTSTFINPLFENFEEADLIDDLTETFQNAQLMVTTDETDEVLNIPGFIPESPPKFFINSNTQGVSINFPAYTALTNITSSSTIQPTIEIDAFGPDYYLHPALYAKTRKRKYSEIV